MFSLFLGFLFGVVTVIAVEVLGIVYLIGRLNRRKDDAEKEKEESISRGLDPQQSLAGAHKKEGVIWVLEPEKVPRSWSAEKLPGEQKRKKDILEVSPVRRHAKIKDRSLILTESNGSHKTIRLDGCRIVAVSATNLSSRKWVKRYPIKLENKTSVIYNRSNTLHIYLESSWEKESWCKALRLASSDDKERLNWFTMLSDDFQTYLKSLNSRYPSFMKPSMGLSYAEPIIDRVNRLDDSSSSKIRLIWKKLARKAPKTGLIDSKPSWPSLSSNGERRISEKTRSFQDSDPSSSSSLSKSGSHSQRSVVSDLDADDKFINDEGSLCWNLLISRLFFDAKGNAKIRRSFQERTQRMLYNMRTPSYIGEVNCTRIDLGNLPPYIHGMRILPTDMNEVWAFEVDIEYCGDAALETETRLEVRELESQKAIVNTDLQSSSLVEATSELLESFADFGNPLNLDDAVQQKNDGDPKRDETKSTKSATSVSRWKSILNSITKQVSQVPISLRIQVSSLRGTMRLHIKPPPSDQLWYGFTSMPDIEFNLDSSVGDRKITSEHIALFLVSRVKVAIRDTLVLPNCESIPIPFMLSEKDDWVPREVAPFIWVNNNNNQDNNNNNQEGASDSTTTAHEISRSKSGEAKTGKTDDSRGDLSDISECRHEKSKTIACVQPSIIHSSGASSLRAGDPSSLKSKSLQDMTTPLLANDEVTGSTESPESSGRPLKREENLLSFESDESKQKRGGRRGKMFDLGKKMGEKLEEKRRTIEERGRNVVERLRAQ